MKPKRNYATISLIVIALMIIGIAMYFGTIHMSKIKFDGTQPIEKNITVINKVNQNDKVMITDSDNINYTTADRLSMYVKPNNNYTVTIKSINNGTGLWIDKFVSITIPKPKKTIVLNST